MSLWPQYRVIPVLVAAAAGLVASAWLESVGTTAKAANDAVIGGTLEIEVRGTGAAPFGIASGITTGVGVGYNLARLQNLQMPTEIEALAGSERYKARARFWLRGHGADRWVLDELTVVYEFHDGTTINYDSQARIVDALGDSGSVTWRDGRWSGTDVDLGQPRIEFERSDDDLWKFSADIAHPVQASGSSSWTSPMGEISLSATRGVYNYRARDFMGNPLPFPFPPLDHSGGWSWNAEFEERWDGEGDFVAFDAFTVLTGADAYEILQLQPMSPVLHKVDAGDWPGSSDFEVKAAVEGPAPRPLKWLFTLYDITCEKGNRLNDERDERATDCSASESYDMELMAYPGFDEPAKWSGGEMWTVETSSEVVEVMLPVLAHDNGGWSRLRADVWIDGEWVRVRVDESDKDYITLPLDEAGGVENHIADGWEAQWGFEGVDPGLDDETSPGGATPGDGLSVYEEYRGFNTFDSGYQRTSPRRKTLFVHAADDSLLGGVRLFERASGLEVFAIDEDDYTGPDDRVVNFNGGFAHQVAQHAVHARYATEVEERPCNAGEKSDETGCDALGSTAAGIMLGSLSTPPGGTKVVLVGSYAGNDTIAHELGHAVGLLHHGHLDFRKAWIEDGGYVACAKHPDTGISPDPNCKAPEGATLRYIAVPRGEHSGQSACLMAYDCARGYTPTGALADVALTAAGHLVPFPHASRRDRFCTNKQPSGGNPVGGAEAGECRSQFKISDTH